MWSGCASLENINKIMQKNAKQMQLKNGLSPIRMQNKSRKMQKNADPILELKLKCKKKARKMQTNFQKNARYCWND